MTNIFESKCLQNYTFQVNREKKMVQEDDVLPRVTEPLFLSALNAKNDTTNPFGYIYKLGESTETNKALHFCSSKDTIQTFNGSI